MTLILKKSIWNAVDDEILRCTFNLDNFLIIFFYSLNLLVGCSFLKYKNIISQDRNM